MALKYFQYGHSLQILTFEIETMYNCSDINICILMYIRFYICAIKIFFIILKDIYFPKYIYGILCTINCTSITGMGTVIREDNIRLLLICLYEQKADGSV